jgi:short subunit fatty acids transporter
MWEQYKKTFWAMQMVIVLVTGGILAWRHLWDLAGLFFITMQAAAVLGAMWGTRLQIKVRRASDRVALR